MIAGVASCAVNSPTITASIIASFARAVEVPAVKLDQVSRSWHEKNWTYSRSYTKVQGLGWLFKDNIGYDEVVNIEDRVGLL